MFVVTEENGKFKDGFCYDNEKDPYQLNRIAFDQMDVEMVKILKKELYNLLKRTNDKWYQKEFCVEFLTEN